MSFANLLSLAEAEVARAQQQLPADGRQAAMECVIWYEPTAEDAENGEEVLGLFEGCTRLDPLPASPEEMPRIRLFLDRLWEYVGGNETAFRREVRTTYLHELGHYLGWDEEQVAALGLA